MNWESIHELETLTLWLHSKDSNVNNKIGDTCLNAERKRGTEEEEKWEEGEGKKSWQWSKHLRIRNGVLVRVRLAAWGWPGVSSEGFYMEQERTGSRNRKRYATEDSHQEGFIITKLDC